MIEHKNIERELYDTDGQYNSSLNEKSVRVTRTIELNGSKFEVDFSDINVHIEDSYKILGTENKRKILEEIVKIGAEEGFTYERSIGSWICEWKAHNALYQRNYEKERTRSVDLNEDESFFRRFCYFFLAIFEKAK